MQKKNYVFYAKRVLGEVLRLEANSTSCTLFMNQSNQKTLQNLKEKLNNMSEKIADWLIRQKAIAADERELYAYAVHCLFSLLYPLVFALVIGAFLQMPIEAVAMIMPFIAVRNFPVGIMRIDSINALSYPV